MKNAATDSMEMIYQLHKEAVRNYGGFTMGGMSVVKREGKYFCFPKTGSNPENTVGFPRLIEAEIYLFEMLDNRPPELSLSTRIKCTLLTVIMKLRGWLGIEQYARVTREDQRAALLNIKGRMERLELLTGAVIE